MVLPYVGARPKWSEGRFKPLVPSPTRHLVDIKRAPQKNTKKYVLYGFGLAVIATVTVALVRLKPAAQSVDRATLIIDSVKRGDMIRDVSAPGTLVPEHIRIIAAQTAGRVEILPLRPGATVQPNTVIAELSNPDVDLQVLQYEQTLSSAISQQATLRTSLQQQQMQQQKTLASLKTQFFAAQRNAMVFDSLDTRGLASRNEVAAARDQMDELKTRLDLEQATLDEMKRSATEQIALGDAFEIEPSVENGLLYHWAQAQLTRELFPECPVKYLPPTRFMDGNLFRTHACDSLFNLVTVATSQGIETIGVPTEGIFTPHVHDRVLGLQNTNYVFASARALGRTGSNTSRSSPRGRGPPSPVDT